jgi:hypothetical protein
VFAAQKLQGSNIQVTADSHEHLNLMEQEEG